MESNSSERVEIPANFEDAPVDDLIQLIADMLERLMSHNDRIPLSPYKSCLLITLFNIDQICARIPLFTLSSLTCHRFVITSIAVSSKGLCDAFCPNNLYARVGGISVTELNVLEREFLSMIDWRLMCTREILQEYYVNLVRTHSADMMDSGQSQPSSPTETPAQPSAVLLEPGTTLQEVIQRPTIEQNMAFAALQQSQEYNQTRHGRP
ncbi:cyclin-domain-containing protein [Flammula alnicola]|nr:cyclin-domain-containing protein [Flammula alnicola]